MTTINLVIYIRRNELNFNHIRGLYFSSDFFTLDSERSKEVSDFIIIYFFLTITSTQRLDPIATYVYTHFFFLLVNEN